MQLPFASDFILLPAFVPSAGGSGYVGNGDNLAMYGIRINDAGGQQLLFGLNPDGNPMVVFEGTVTAIYITRLDAATTVLPLTLYVGTDCDLGFLGAVFG